MGRKLLFVNFEAGSVDESTAALLRRELPGYELVDRLPRRLQADVVAVAGGDGTIAAVGRRLAGTDTVLGLIPAGTFNNFAKALGLPLEPVAAARRVRQGRPQSVTVGRVNGVPFLEAAAIGLFGDAIALGETAKELRFGELPRRLRALARDRPFRYRVSGGASLEGEALSIVISNTPSTGARLPLGETTPRDPYLELAAGRRRRRIGEALVETEPRMRVYADAGEAGETPAVVQTVPGGLKVLL